MHEMSLMQGILDSVENAACEAGAIAVSEVRLSIGQMTEIVPDAMDFAFEALSPGTLCEGAQLKVTMIAIRSKCNVCDHEFEHDRYHWGCPKCDSLATELLAGREMYIESIEVEMLDEEPQSGQTDGRDAIVVNAVTEPLSCVGERA